MAYLVDFEERFEKPNFEGRDGYFEDWPKGPFLIEDADFRGCVKVLVFIVIIQL